MFPNRLKNVRITKPVWAYGLVVEHVIRIDETAVRFRLGPQSETSPKNCSARSRAMVTSGWWNGSPA